MGQKIGNVKATQKSLKVQWETNLMKVTQNVKARTAKADSDALKIAQDGESEANNITVTAKTDASATVQKSTQLASTLVARRAADSDSNTARLATKAGAIKLHSNTGYNATSR